MAEQAEDNSTILGEIRRLARTSGAVTGIAARIAGQRVFGIATDRARHAEDLKAIIGGLKGPMMKVAQILTTIPDALPDEYARELAQLQANAPAMGWPFVRRRMTTELGSDWEEKFLDFGRDAAAAASLGQVHRARLLDGREVACKLQYPDMVSTVEADLRQLKLAMAVYKRIDNAIHHDDIYIELATRLREELDYQREAAHLRLYRVMLANQHDIATPAPIPEFSTKRLLTMSWLDGVSVQKWLATDPDQESRNRVARALFRAWYVPFYRYGIIHGDPHLGNYQISPGGGINLLDFGSIRVFHSSFVVGVIELFEAIRDGNDERAHHAYTIWGFTDLTKEKLDVLNQWARFLYEPLMQDRARRIQETNDVTFGRSIAEKVHEGLKRTGGVRPPREFVLMDRSAIGLGSVFMRLGAELNWQRLFQETAVDFDATALDIRQRAAMEAAGVAPPL
jgi:predicted unusual protein kinase regulating ubiquinone biosynthesis (AarF/ABC1/UbiB family)